MYNYSYDFPFYQCSYVPQCYQWNYPIMYLPVSSEAPCDFVDNSSHYQIIQVKKQNPMFTKEEKSSQNEVEDELRYNSQEFLQVQSQKSVIKKKRKYYGTKNTEANIINQTFSYMNCGNKSRKVMQKLLKGDSIKIDIFYIMMKIVKRSLKKYVNRCFLKGIFEMDRTNFTYKLLSKGIKRLQILSIEEFKKIFRCLVFYYFTNEMPTHLLSSNRLSRNTIGEHLKRRRQIMEHIFGVKN